MSLLVIVPSRGRPQNMDRLMNAWRDTNAEAHLMVGVDDDDPTLDEYVALGSVVIGPRTSMAGTLNTLAVQAAGLYDQIGFMGDDHLPRTLGWDALIGHNLRALGTGIVYGNDLIHGANLPTAVFMTADIICATGWMVPPGIRHLYADNAWKALGEQLNAIRYLPGVVIEHLHPIAGKAEWDPGYVEVNAGDVAEHDRAVYERWLADGLPGDVEKIRALACVS